MDFNLKQWREQVQQQQHESEEHQEQAPSAKIPRHPLPPPTPLSLFITEPTTIKTTKNDMSASSSDSTPTIFPRVGSYFSLSQWKELELQALIFRHMLAGAAIPVELLYLVKKSLINTNPYYFTHPLQHFPHFNHSLMQSSGYWGKGAMDPEPTRCRRTDGKKWRCSRDVVDGHKYCERHVHRGRNRSRKPVEIPTPPPTSSSSSVVSGLLKFSHAQPIASGGTTDALVSVSGPSPSFDLLRFGNRSSSTVKNEENKSEVDKSSGDKNKTLLRHFFDDWSRPPIQESENAISISTPTMPSVSDVSLKLSTGVVGTGGTEGGGGQRQPEESHGGGSGGGRGTWGPSNQMGGPLAEALRSSTSNSSPTSVLHH